MSVDHHPPPADTPTTTKTEIEINLTEKFLEDRVYRRGGGGGWFVAMPVRQIIPAIYSSLNSSGDVQPFQLLSLAQTLFAFLTQLHKDDWEHERYLEMLDALFSRLLTMQFDAGDQFDEFIDSLWTLHNNNGSFFLKSTIPEKVVHVHPSKLEQVLSASIKNKNKTKLLPLLEKSPENFKKVMEILSGQKTEIIFGSNLLSELRERLGCKFYSLFPTPFHPLVHLLHEVNFENINDLLVRGEIKNLLGVLFYQSKLFRFDISIINFIVQALFFNPRRGGGGNFFDVPWLKMISRK